MSSPDNIQSSEERADRRHPVGSDSESSESTVLRDTNNPPTRADSVTEEKSSQVLGKIPGEGKKWSYRGQLEVIHSQSSSFGKDVLTLTFWHRRNRSELLSME